MLPRSIWSRMVWIFMLCPRRSHVGGFALTFVHDPRGPFQHLGHPVSSEIRASHHARSPARGGGIPRTSARRWPARWPAPRGLPDRPRIPSRTGSISPLQAQEAGRQVVGGNLSPPGESQARGPPGEGPPGSLVPDGEQDVGLVTDQPGGSPPGLLVMGVMGGCSLSGATVGASPRCPVVRRRRGPTPKR